jgi:carboxyl-terminal processing protease
MIRCRFETLNGRTVYGGGGIMPDIFIPLETGEHTIFFNQVANRGVLYRFAFDYSDRNRPALSRYENAGMFVSEFRVGPSLYEEFVSFAVDQGIEPGPGDHSASELLIRNHLKAYIGRNLLGNEAFFLTQHAMDPAFMQALEVLREDRVSIVLSATEPL